MVLSSRICKQAVSTMSIAGSDCGIEDDFRLNENLVEGKALHFNSAIESFFKRFRSARGNYAIRIANFFYQRYFEETSFHKIDILNILNIRQKKQQYDALILHMNVERYACNKPTFLLYSY